MVDLNNLLQNKLLLQYMSSAGAALSAGQPAAGALDEVTQQSITAQNFSKMLAKLMGDAASSKTPGKISMDGTKFKYETEMGGMSGPISLEPGGSTQTGSASVGASKTPTQPQVNPLSSSAFSSADLAGLTPEMISQALQFKFGLDQAKQKKITDAADIAYKEQLARESAAREAALTPSIDVPGIGKLTRSQYIDWWKTANKDERSAAIKNYEYAQTEKGGGFKGSFEQFQEGLTVHQKDYDAAVEGGYEGSFNEWLLQMRKAGATRISIGEKVAQRKAFAGVDAVAYFTDPKGLTADVDKHIESEEVQNQLFQFATDPRQRDIETVRAKEKFITGKITAAGGTITESKLDGRTFVFTVQWPDGTTSEVRYAN